MLGAVLHASPAMKHPTVVAAIALVATVCGAVLGLAQTARPAPPLVIHSMYGRDLYEFYCASCHGKDGRGSGPVVPALRSEPPDLTRLTLHNGGVFPRARIEAIVDGRIDPPLVAHGTREMPVWGPIFRGLDGNETANRLRIANIVDYVQSLQVRYARLSQPDRRGPATRVAPR